MSVCPKCKKQELKPGENLCPHCKSEKGNIFAKVGEGAAATIAIIIAIVYKLLKKPT